MDPTDGPITPEPGGEPVRENEPSEPSFIRFPPPPVVTSTSDEPPPEFGEPPPPTASNDEPDRTGEILPPPVEKKKGSFLKELPILILIAFGLALLIKSFLIQAFYIPSESMVPTLNIGDRVLVNKVIYKLRNPTRGEIIVFVGERSTKKRSFWTRLRENITSGLGGAQPAEKDFIKRVIGLPGETVEMKDGKVSITPVHGATFALNEPYLAQQPDLTPFGPYKVPSGSYFVMGDNRANSSDSRGSLGPIKKKEIVGRAFVRIWPLRRFRIIHRQKYETLAGAALIVLPIGFRLRRRSRRAA